MSYEDKALKSKDPRFAEIFRRMGRYDTKELRAESVPEPDIQQDEKSDLEKAREDYLAVVGQPAAKRWSIAVINQKISEFEG